jgi:hypothetical protein
MFATPETESRVADPSQTLVIRKIFVAASMTFSFFKILSNFTLLILALIHLRMLSVSKIATELSGTQFEGG